LFAKLKKGLLMKAMLCESFGPLENVLWKDIDDPVLTPDKVRVRIHASSIGFMDALMLKGLYQLKPALPYVPGACGAGEVIEVGSQVRNIHVGDRVSFLNYFGAFAEQIVTDEASIVVLPPSMSYEQAATYRLSYNPAYLGLVYRANLQPGETLLVTGASGGVGLAAVRLGKVLGARVIGAIGTAEKESVVRQAGADEIVNYNQAAPLREQVKALTNGKGADVILDVVGGDVFDECMRCLNFMGRIIVMGFTSGRIAEAKTNLVLLKNASILGVFLGGWMTRDLEGLKKLNHDLLRLAEDGKIPAIITNRFQMHETVLAMNTLLSRKTVGKIVLENRF
jgi:NADPH2:quinone reductase